MLFSTNITQSIEGRHRVSVTTSGEFKKAGAEEQVTSRVLTVPNVISLARLLLVPVYLWLLFSGMDVPALVVFSVAAATDFVDGQVARRTHQVSRLGKLLDPAIDTILMLTGVLGVVAIGRLPVWFAVLVIAREAFLLVGGGVLLARFKISIPVVYPGKVATTLLFVGFAGMLLNMPVVPGAGVCDLSWLPGFNHDAVAVWVWVLYAGLALQIGVTVYYCVQAWGRLKAALAEGRK